MALGTNIEDAGRSEIAESHVSDQNKVTGCAVQDIRSRQQSHMFVQIGTGEYMAMTEI